MDRKKAVATDLDNTIICSISPSDLRKSKHTLESLSEKYPIFDIMLKEYICRVCNKDADIIASNGRKYCISHKPKTFKGVIYSSNESLQKKKKIRISFDNYMELKTKQDIIYIIKDEENLSYKDIYKELDWKADNIIPEACIEYYVFFRPHYEAFVLFCSQNFHFGVWTAATSDYAQFIVDRFGIKVEYLFYDEHVNMSEELKLSKYTFEVNRNTPIKYYRKQVNHYHKDLSLLRTFLSCSEIAIIDDRKFVHEDQKQNSVYLKAFILVDDKEYDNGKKNIYISENKGVLTLEGFVPVYYDLIVKFYRELNNIKNIKKISYTKINPLYINYDIKYKDQLINFVNNLEDRTLIVVMYILDIWNKTNLMKEYDKPFDKYSLEIPTFIGQYLSKLN